MRNHVSTRAAITVASVVALSLCSLPSHAEAVRLINKTNDWSLYMHEEGAAKICFALAQPKDTEPKAIKRGQAYLYVSAWPKDGVKGEVSVRIGYPFKKGSNATAAVAGINFTLFTKDDKAFIENPTDELKLIEAMKKGGRMVITGMSERGTLTVDTYSLAGLGQALQALATNCQ